MKSILFADDQKNIREFCSASLEDEGYRVITARDGFEALEMFTAEMPDLAILDISMPRLNGLQVFERMHDISPGTPIVLFTACDEDCLNALRTQLGMECVEKAEDLAELKRVVARILNGSIVDESCQIAASQQAIVNS